MKLFQNLSLLAKSTATPAHPQRHQQSADAYQAGMQILLQAQQDSFKDLSQLKVASDHFLESIRNHHRNPEPLIAMAYLLNLVEDYPGALRYLSEALRVDPGNQSAYSLQLAIQDQARAAAQNDSQAHAPVSNPVTSADSDLAYDQLEDLLDREVRLMSSFPPPRATAAREQILELESQYQELNQNYEMIQEQLELLPEDHEMMTLHARLGPIENRLRLYQRVLGLSRSMHSLNESLEQEYEAMMCLGQYLQFQSAQSAYQQLESTLDACDDFADAVNALEDKGAEVQELESAYRRLSEAVLQLQEAIDDMKS